MAAGAGQPDIEGKPTMNIWDDIGQFVINAEAEQARIQQQQNGLNLSKPTDGSGSGSGYTVSPEELQSLLAQWRDLDNTLVSAIGEVNNTSGGITAPGIDSASVTAAGATEDTMSAYLTHLTAMKAYADNYVQTLTKALSNYQSTEAGNRGSATNVHTDLTAP
jgi:hypothetical protein